MIKEFLVACALLLFFSGCVRQNVEITLKADGSGTLVLEKVLSSMESAMMTVAEVSAGNTHDLYEITESEKKGPLVATLKKSIPTKDNAEDRLHAEYRFSELGRAIPSISKELVMCPRFAYRGGRFIVFLDREKQDFDGQKIEEDDVKKMFYHLSVTFPEKPESPNGNIKGKRVSWKFSGEELLKLMKLDVGTRILEASIPASALTTEIKPLLVKKKERLAHSSKNKKSALEEFSSQIKIWEKEKSNKVDYNSKLSLLFPLGDRKIPFPYDQLKIEKVIFDGKTIDGVKLVSPESGVFSGKDRWGRVSDGFPVALTFNQFDPWVKRLDSVEVSMNVKTALSQKKRSFTVTEKDAPYWFENDSLAKTALLKVELGSSRATWPSPSLELLTSLVPEKVISFFLDTDYGLRYETERLNWEEPDADDLANLTESEEGLTKMKKVTLFYPNIPSGPFRLVCIIPEGEGSKKITLELEGINVSH